MIRYKLLLLFFGLAFWSCEETEDPDNSINIIECSLDTLFSREVGGPGNTDGYDIERLDDCSYVGVGKSSSRPWIMKIDEAGYEIWS